jgi:hypothetical protein
VSRSPRNGDPNLKWVLGPDVVKDQSGHKADDALRDSAGDLGETIVFSDRRVRKAIQSSTNPLQLSSAVQPEQVFSRNPDTFDVAGADDRAFPRERQHLI